MMLFNFLILNFIIGASYDSYGVMFEDEEKTILKLAPEDLKIYVVPASVEIIRGGTEQTSAFYNCRSNIRSLTFSKGSKLKTLERFSFYKCNIEGTINMSMCEHLTEISEASFGSCNKIAHFIFPPNIKNIKSGSFTECKSLKEAKFPASLESIGCWTVEFSAAYYSCSSLSIVEFDPNVKINYFGYDLFSFCNISTIQIPATLTTFVGSSLMKNPMTSITVQSGNSAFFTDNIILMDSGKTRIFYCCPIGCRQDIIPNTVTTLEDSSFRYSELDTIIIPSSVNIIRVHSFSFSKLTHVTIPSSVSLLSSAFLNCTLLSSVTFEGSFPSLEQSCFISCISLKEVIVPNGVTSLFKYVFANDKSLTHVVIPSTVSSIGSGCFYGTNESLTVEIISNPNFKIDNGIMYTSSYNRLIVCVDRTKTDVVIDSRVSEVDEYSFYQCQLSSIDFSVANSLTKIMIHAFDGNQLTKVVLPQSITTVDSYSFASNPSLSSVEFKASLTYIGKCAFLNTSLASINIPSVQSIGAEAFAIETLETVHLGNNLNTIGDRCFAGSKIKLFTVPPSCTSVGRHILEGSLLETLILESSGPIWEYSFAGCTKLANVYINSGSIRTIGRSAFEGCVSLKVFDLGSSITTIELNAFKDCALLESVRIPDDSQLSSIEGLAFEGCDSLRFFNVSESNKNFTSEAGVLYDKDKEEIVIYLPASERTQFDVPESVKMIHAYSFQNARNLEVVNISKCNIESIGFKAFSGCSRLGLVLLPPTLQKIDSLAFERCPSLGCDSIAYDGDISMEVLFADSMINAGALVPCPTEVFSIELRTHETCYIGIMLDCIIDQ